MAAHIWKYINSMCKVLEILGWLECENDTDELFIGEGGSKHCLNNILSLAPQSAGLSSMVQATVMSNEMKMVQTNNKMSTGQNIILKLKKRDDKIILEKHNFSPNNFSFDESTSGISKTCRISEISTELYSDLFLALYWW